MDHGEFVYLLSPRTFRDYGLLMCGLLVAPFAIIGYVGFSALLILPLLALRRTSPSQIPWVPATATTRAWA